VCWGSDYWFVIVCVFAGIAGLELCLLGLCLRIRYCLWWGSKYWFVIEWFGGDFLFGVVCGVAVFPGLLLWLVWW